LWRCVKGISPWLPWSRLGLIAYCAVEIPLDKKVVQISEADIKALPQFFSPASAKKPCSIVNDLLAQD